MECELCGLGCVSRDPQLLTGTPLAHGLAMTKYKNCLLFREKRIFWQSNQAENYCVQLVKWFWEVSLADLVQRLQRLRNVWARWKHKNHLFKINKECLFNLIINVPHKLNSIFQIFSDNVTRNYVIIITSTWLFRCKHNHNAQLETKSCVFVLTKIIVKIFCQCTLH